MHRRLLRVYGSLRFWVEGLIFASTPPGASQTECPHLSHEGGSLYESHICAEASMEPKATMRERGFRLAHSRKAGTGKRAMQCCAQVRAVAACWYSIVCVSISACLSRQTFLDLGLSIHLSIRVCSNQTLFTLEIHDESFKP